MKIVKEYYFIRINLNYIQVITAVSRYFDNRHFLNTRKLSIIELKQNFACRIYFILMEKKMLYDQNLEVITSYASKDNIIENRKIQGKETFW